MAGEGRVLALTGPAESDHMHGETMIKLRAVPFLLMVPALSLSQVRSAPSQVSQTAPAERARSADAAEDRLVRTEHIARIGGADVRYSATTGSLVLRNSAGKAMAHVFFVAYAREGQDPAARPITFSYNGGPGSASIWLHMGLMGPKRVQMASHGFQPSPPYQIVANEDSPLDVTDIVMVDPVQTGYSRAAEGESASQFHGVRPDIESVAEFIRLYVTKFDRWRSPKYLLGESYGTMRSAGVAEELQNRHGIELNGIVLLSSILDYQTKGYVSGNDYPHANFLPSYTASAWYHKKLPADLQGGLEKALEESRAFAFGEYLQALVRGNRLTLPERRSVALKVSRYSGLSVEFIEQANLRVSDQRFRKELLRDRGVMIGRLDGRYTALDADNAGEMQEFDPSNHALNGPYTSLYLDYLRRELKYESELQYFTSGPVQPWDYRPYQNRYLNLVDALRSTMAKNPFVRVLVLNGYYDFATPFGATEYSFDHLGYDATYKDRVSMKYYEGGHMMYIVPSILRQVKRDLAQFIESTRSSPVS
jgi:carboxypeptidase C (cathepsin A)